MAKHAVVRTDNLMGTDVRSMLVSIRYMGAEGTEAKEIENGNVVKVDALVEGEREVFIGKDVKASDKLDDIVLLAAPEVMYDERLRNLDDYINEKGKNIRGYHLHSGGIFSLTKEALIGEEAPAVGDIVELADGTKFNVVKSASGATVVGKIIEVEIAGRYTYYAIKVN